MARKFTILNNDQKYLDSIVNNINNNENVCVVSLSKEYALHLRDKLKILYPQFSDKIVCIHKDADKMLKNELKDIRTNFCKYKVLIYTPIIGVGLNFDIENHFGHIYGYLVGHIESARVFMQMIGRIRYPTNKDVVILISPKVSQSTNSQLYSLEFAHQHQKSIIENDYFKCEKILQYDQNGHLILKKTVKFNTFNRLRAYYIQETQLNNRNTNILTSLKFLIESKGDIFETFFSEKTESINIKKNIDRIIEMPNVTDDEYKKLLYKKNPTENDELVMKKVQMRHQLNLAHHIDNNVLNNCLKISNKYKDIINRILTYNSKNKKLKIVDLYDGVETKHIYTIFEKVINAFDCKNITGEKNYDMKLDDVIKNINITKAEIKSLNVKGKNEDKYETIKVVLWRFGINLHAVLAKKQVKGVRKNFRIGYILSYDKSIYDLIYCKIINNSSEYENDFVDFIKNFDAYSQCISVYNKKIKTINEKKLKLF